MTKPVIDKDAIAELFSQSTAKQGEALRKAVGDATLKALQGRDLTMANITSVVKTITTAASTGAAKNTSSPVDVEAMLATALAGMDGALLKAVEANQKALQYVVDQGAGLHEKQLKGALANLEKLEDTFFASVGKAVEGIGAGPMAAPWEHVLSAMKLKGTDTGTQATQTVAQFMEQTRTALRDSRATGAKTAQALLDGYATLVRGVLIGMSEGLGAAAAPATSNRSKK